MGGCDWASIEGTRFSSRWVSELPQSLNTKLCRHAESTDLDARTVGIESNAI